MYNRRLLHRKDKLKTNCFSDAIRSKSLRCQKKIIIADGIIAKARGMIVKPVDKADAVGPVIENSRILIHSSAVKKAAKKYVNILLIAYNEMSPLCLAIMS